MSRSAQTPPNTRAVRIALRSMQTVGAIALLIALANSGYVLGYVSDCVRMQSWVATRATVTDATFAPQTPEFPPRVIVTFRYLHDGAEYTGHRADAAQGTYFTGDFVERQAEQLAEHAKDGTTTTCFVNPADPAEAVLDRHFSPTVLAARSGILLLPIMGGSLFFFAAGYVLRREAKMGKAAKRYPGQPWLWREDWRAQHIFSETRSGAWMLYGFAGIYLAFALPLGLMVLDEQGFGMFGVGGIIMLIVGWGAISLSAQRLFGRKRFDCAQFVMATPTGVIGGPLSGVAKLNSRLAGEGTFRASLECAYFLPGSGDSSGQEVVEWRDTILIDKPLASTDPFVIAVPIYFAIPYDVRECDLLSPRPVTWRLKVGLDGDEGVGYYARFEVPVFKTPESSPTFKADPQLLAGHEQRMSIDQVLKENGCRVETIAGGEAIRFSIYKQWALWGGLGIVAACGVGAWALIKYVHFGWAAIPGIFAAILVFGLCELLLWSSRIILQPDGVTVSAGYPLVRRPRMLTTDEFGRFEGGVEFEMTERTWHCVWLIAADGNRWMIAKRIATRREADAIGDWLTEKARATLLPIEQPVREK